ncbi:MAG: hypothetical protein ACFFCD_04350 [Promethearchaeota archaeon]
MVINGLQEKKNVKERKIEVLLITCIMLVAPVLFFFLLSSFSVFLTVAAIELMCIMYLGIRKNARNQLKKKTNRMTEIPFHNSERINTPQSVNYVENNVGGNGSIQLYVPDLNEESLFIIDTFNELEFYEVFLDLKGKEETVMLLTKNPNSLPEWMCGIMAFKIERFTKTHTQDHITAILDHLTGKTFSISYVTDLDHAYIRVIKERPITSTFPAAANVLVAELLEDFLLVYDAFITEFPGCEIRQLVDNALISHLFGVLVDFESRSEIIELTAKKKEIEMELEYNKIELNSVRAFFLPKQLRTRYSTIARTNDLYYYDMTEGGLDVAPFLLAATMAMQFQNYTTAIILAVSLLAIGIIIKYLRSRNEPTAIIKLKKLVPTVDKVFINGNYAFVQKKGNVFHALAIHQIGEGIPRTGNNISTYSQENPVTKSDGLQKLFRTLTKNRSNLKAFIHAKGRVANTNVELVNEEVLDNRRMLYNPEPYFQITPYFVVTQPFVYDGREKFAEFLSRFDEANQQLKLSIKNAFPTLKLIPTNPKKVALSFEYFLSQLYSAYSIETVQLNQSEKDSTIKVGVFKRPLEADSCYLSNKESQGFFEVVSGVAKRYQPAQFAIPAKTDSTILLGYAVDTISDTVTTREVGFDLQHLRTNIGVYGLDHVTTVRRIIHELCKRRFNVILIDPQYSERAKRKEPNYYDLPAHLLKLGVDFSFNPLDRMGGNTGDFIDGFLNILQKIYGKGDLSRWQFVTKKLKELYETKAKESGREPTLVELLEDLEFSEDEEFVEFATSALEELKDVLERILSDFKRINAIGGQTSHPFHILFNTEGLTVIDLSTFADRNFLSFLLQLLIHSISTYRRNSSSYQNTVLIIENSDMVFPEASYLVSYRYRSRVEKLFALESLRNTSLILSMESPSETPYLFNLPRTKIIGRVTSAADIELVSNTLGLKERAIGSHTPHPLQESYFRTMKSGHALLYLQRKGEEAQYVPLKIEEVPVQFNSTETNEEKDQSTLTTPIRSVGQLKQTMLEKDFDRDTELYYDVLYALRDMGDRGTPYSALPEMLPDIDEKQLAKAMLTLIKKRYVFRNERSPRDSYKQPLATIQISPKGIEALEEYEEKAALEIQQSVAADEILTGDSGTFDEIVKVGHPEPKKGSLIGRETGIEDYLKSIEEKTSPNARDLLKQAHELRSNYPQAATSSIVFCYDAIKWELLKLLEIDTDAKIELDQIVSALVNCEISLPVGYPGLQNIIQKHKQAIIQGILLEQADIDAIIGNSELIVAELEKYKLSVRDRVRVIKAILSGDGEQEKDELREERGIEDWKEEEKIDTADPFVEKTFPSNFVMGTVAEEEIGIHNDLNLNGLLKDIWEIVGRDGGLKSVIKTQLILRNAEYDNLGIERAINAMINRGLLYESEGFLQRCQLPHPEG